jgi:four helix bundle protein
MAVKDYRELIVWQKAIDLVESVYRQTAGFPQQELYGLTSQMRRAAVSIPSNIAEGQGRDTTADFLRFLAIAHGSLKEVETQIYIARRLDYLDERQLVASVDRTEEVGRLLSGLKRPLKGKSTSPAPRH